MLSEPAKIRVKFSKTGSLKFISHLDLNRTVKSAFLRSALPIWYTQGLNPHPKTVFSLPLSVGTASLCEFMDFRITEEISGEEICARLNAVFPAGLCALAAYAPTTKFQEIGWADYEIRITSAENAVTAETVSAVTAALSGEVLIQKTTKIGTREVDIAPLMRVLSLTEENGELVLSLRLCSDEKNFVNPKYVIDHLTKTCSFPDGCDDYTICRTAVWLADGITPFL